MALALATTICQAHRDDDARPEVEEHRTGHALPLGIVVNTLMRQSCASLPLQYTPQNLLPI
jgi:hypothetical protein